MNAMIDETIERVEQLYRTVTGAPPPTPNGHRAAFPPQVDPGMHVQEQLGRVVATLQQIVPSAAEPTWIPRAAAWSQEDDVVFSLDVPGVAREHVHVHVAPHTITVTGRRPTPPSGTAACDAPFGAFARMLPLAMRVTPEQISARLDAGVLTIRIHTSTQATPSQITISS